MPTKHRNVNREIPHTNTTLVKRGKRLGWQIVTSGEKDPAENLVTVARRYREEALPVGRKTFA
jgi:hypothetical protein